MLTSFTLLCFMVLAYSILVPFFGLLIDIAIESWVQEFGPFGE